MRRSKLNMNRILGRVRSDERGIALVMAIGMLTVCSIMVVTVIQYTSAGQRTSAFSKTRLTAFDAADAGMNNTYAVLNLPTNNSLHQDILPSCHTTNPNPGNGAGQTPNSTWFGSPTNFAATSGWNHNTYGNATVDWCGDLDLSAAQWYLWAIGRVKNPTGPTTGNVTRTLFSKVSVVPTMTQPLNNPSWNYIYATRTGNACDQTFSNNVGGQARLYIAGNLCLNNNAGVTNGPLIVRGNLDLANNSFVGDDANMASRVETYVGNQCRAQKSTNTWVTCTGNQDANYIFSKLADGVTVGVTHTPPTIAAPSADFATWYANSMPGPTQGCTTSSGTPPTFDNNSTRDNSVAASFDLTPASSYTCRVGPGANTTLSSAITAGATSMTVPSATGFPASGSYTVSIDEEDLTVTAGAGGTTWTVTRGANGTTAAAHSAGATVTWNNPQTVGELSWNATAKTLTVSGTIFIDGSAKVTQTANYNGQATIYLSGTMLFTGSLCGVPTGSSCIFSNWNPNTEMLTFVANGTGGQVAAGDSVQLTNNAYFQGGVFATGNADYSNNASSDGPIMASQVLLSNNVTTSGFPTITTVPVGMPGNPAVYAQPNPPQSFSG
jgi:hypothetical protein